MIQYCLKAFFCIFLLFAPFSLLAQPISPFQDYAKCKTGFLRGKRDTVYTAKYDQIKEFTYKKKIQSNVWNQRTAWIVKEKNLYGCLDDRGNWVFPVKYEKIEFNNTWYAFVVKENGKEGLVSVNDSLLIPFEYDELYSEVHQNIQYGWICAKKGNQIGLFNREAELVVPAKYQKIERIHLEKDHLGSSDFFKVWSEDGVGLYFEDGRQLLSAEYMEVELLTDSKTYGDKLVFVVTNKAKQKSIVDDSGKLICPYGDLKYFPAYRVADFIQMTSNVYIRAVDSLDRVQLYDLRDGRKSNFYNNITIVGDFVVAYEQDRFLILDTNFNFLKEYVNTNDVLETFDGRGNLSERNQQDWISFEEWREIVTELEKKYDRQADLPVLRIHRTSVLSKRQMKRTGNKVEEFYGIYNLDTGKSSPVIYEQLLRIGSHKGVYYWGIRQEEHESGFMADVYDSTGLFLRSTRFNKDEYDQINEFVKDEGYCLRPFIRLYQKDNVKGTTYSGLLMNGNRISDYIFTEEPYMAAQSSDSTGVLSFHSGNNGFRLTDFTNKPLYNNRTFYTSPEWAGVLHDGPNANKYDFDVWQVSDKLLVMVDDKCNILLDSCSRIQRQRFTGHLGLDSTQLYMSAHKNGYYYVQINGVFVPMDSTFFANPCDVNSVESNIKVNNKGEILLKEQPQKFEFGNVKCVRMNSTLTVSDTKGKFIQEITDVVNVGRLYSVIYVVNTQKKVGLIDPKTGKWFFKPKFNEIHQLDMERTDAFFVKDASISEKWLIVGQDGTPLTAPIFDQSQGLRKNTWTAIRSNGKFGTLGTDFKFICPPVYKNKVDVGEAEVLTDDGKYALIDKSTGKVFEFTKNLVNKSYANGYLFYFNDSIQFLSFSGEQIIAPTPVAEALVKINLSKVFYAKTNRNKSNSEVIGGVTYCSDQDTALWRHYNRELLEDAKRWALAWNQITFRELQIQKKNVMCKTEPIQVRRQFYAELVSGTCFEQPKTVSGVAQTYSYRNYRMLNGELKEVKLQDILFSNSTDLSTIESYLQKRIQEEQYFGPNCVDVPGILEEFKRNFYITANAIVFVHYPAGLHIEVPFLD